MPSAGFELAIPENDRPQNHVLDCAAIGIGLPEYILLYNNVALAFIGMRICVCCVTVFT